MVPLVSSSASVGRLSPSCVGVHQVVQQFGGCTEFGHQLETILSAVQSRCVPNNPPGFSVVPCFVGGMVRTVLVAEPLKRNRNKRSTDAPANAGGGVSITPPLVPCAEILGFGVISTKSPDVFGTNILCRVPKFVCRSVPVRCF